MNLTSVMTLEAEVAKIKSRRAWLSAMTVLLACAMMFIMQLVCSFAIAFLFPDVQGEVLTAVIEMVCYVIYLTVPFGIAAIIFKTCLKAYDSYKPKYVTPKKPVLYILGAVGIGYIVNVTVNLLFGWLINLFDMPTVEAPQTTAGIILLYISTAVFPAVLEEWAFRGVILKNLLPYGRKGAILISSLLFGIMHVDPARVIFATAFGLLLGICYEYTRSIKIPMIIHFINNAIAVTSSLSLDNDVMIIIMDVVVYSFMGFGVAALIYYIRNGIQHKKISLNRPLHVGYKLTSGRYLLKTLLNPGVIPLALLYLFIFAAQFFASYE